MAAFVDNSSLDVSERNSIAITLNIHTKSHTFRGRPTLKVVERFGNGSVRELYEWSLTSEPVHVNTSYNRVFRRDRELWNISEERTLKEITKNVYKLHMKGVRLYKVAQLEKKYLLKCSVFRVLINSANHLASIMNIGSQLRSSLSQLTNHF